MHVVPINISLKVRLWLIENSLRLINRLSTTVENHEDIQALGVEVNKSCVH